MSTLFQTDKQRVKLYMTENAGWLKTIITQADEIPTLKKMMKGDNMLENDEKIGIEKELFTKELMLQEEEMIKLNTALNQQQQRLKTDTAKKYLYDIDSLCNQDILRGQDKRNREKIYRLEMQFYEIFIIHHIIMLYENCLKKGKKNKNNNRETCQLLN